MAEMRNVLDGLVRHLDQHPDATAFRTIDDETWSWRDYADRAAAFAGGLAAQGVQPGDRVVLMLRNRLEFHAADLGVLLAGATAVSIYNSSSPEQIGYLVTHCKAIAAITEEGDFLDRFLAADTPTLRVVIVVGGESDGCVGFDEVAAGPAVDIRAVADATDPTQLLTVIYTSGTTGPPKGVMLDHTNLLAAYKGLIHFHDPDEDPLQIRLVSYLPMAHIAERNVSHYNHLLHGGVVTPCPDLAQLGSYLLAVRPTQLFGPPRVWEKLAAGIQAAVAARPEEDRARFADALAIGRQVQTLRAQGEELPADLAATWEFVEEVAFRPLRAVVGLDACTIAFSGAAPIPPEVIDFIRDLGVEMSEIYGMSENTGGMTWEPHLVRSGRVGRAYPHTEVITAPDGEVLCRGAIVFKGYLDDPQRTREALDDDGWLHTGDIGEFDEDGYLKIVDRKKELIITAGGKNVSPANIEAALKTISLIGQAMAIGDARPYLVALLTVDPDTAGVQYPGRSLAEIAADPEVLADVAAAVADVNARLSTVEHIRRFVLLGEEWLPDTALLTPTMKLKRRGVLATYESRVEEMYAGGGVEVEPARTMAAAP
ncbi:MAG TPA: long-chain fatty acid--CoA ligase [Mycobacteriales bacterium]|jgi:long-chain acyl-CoA synthetase|nr:long-chain fatty acid--CoA ligase [Mycobacteriales bacterium]